MTSRILVDAETFRSLLSKHPEIEVDLLRNAVPQIAEIIRRKAVEKEPSIKALVDQTFSRLMHEMGSRHAITDGMKTVIRFYLGEVWEKEFKALAAKAAEEFVKDAAAVAIDRAVKETKRQIAVEENLAQKRIGEWARAAAEREVVALLRSGGLVAAPVGAA